jgi:type II secretory pathway predicted ATPase ExeA
VSADADESKVSATVFPLNGESKFVWVSDRHRQVLNTLDAAIQDGRGVLLLTGESGTGKTVLTRILVERLAGAGVRVGWLPSPNLEAFEFREVVGEGLPDFRPAGGNFLGAFRRFLHDVLAHGQRVLLVVDDAHVLRPHLFAELQRLLAVDRPIGVFNILLVGRSELETILREPHYGGLAELIRVRYTVHPLTTLEVASYVQDHLRAAGFDPKWFTLEAMEEVWRCSGGIPRTINVICNQTMRAALLTDAPTVDADLVRRCLLEKASDLGVKSKGVVERLLDMRRAIFASNWPPTEPEGLTKAAAKAVAEFPVDFADEDHRGRIRIGGVAVLGVALAFSSLFYLGWRLPSRDTTKPSANGVVEQQVDRSDTVELPERPQPSPTLPPRVSTPPAPARAAPPNPEPPRSVTAEKASLRRSETASTSPGPSRAAAGANGEAPGALAHENASLKFPEPAPASTLAARDAAPAAVAKPRAAAQDEPDPNSIIEWLLKQSPGRPD